MADSDSSSEEFAREMYGDASGVETDLDEIEENRGDDWPPDASSLQGPYETFEAATRLFVRGFWPLLGVALLWTVLVLVASVGAGGEVDDLIHRPVEHLAGVGPWMLALAVVSALIWVVAIRQLDRVWGPDVENEGTESLLVPAFYVLVYGAVTGAVLAGVSYLVLDIGLDMVSRYPRTNLEQISPYLAANLAVLVLGVFLVLGDLVIVVEDENVWTGLKRSLSLTFGLKRWGQAFGVFFMINVLHGFAVAGVLWGYEKMLPDNTDLLGKSREEIEAIQSMVTVSSVAVLGVILVVTFILTAAVQYATYRSLLALDRYDSEFDELDL